MADLYKNYEADIYDGLITDIKPKIITAAATLKHGDTKLEYKRGTVMAKGADGKLIALGSDVDTTGTFSATGNGSTKKFDLVDGGIIPSAIIEVKVGGTATTAYTYNAQIGELEFESAPANAATIAVKYSTGGGGAYAILCDDTEVGTTADANALVYLAGSFDPARLIVAEGYTMTEADIDALRNGGIFLKAQIDADYVAP